MEMDLIIIGGNSKVMAEWWITILKTTVSVVYC